MLDHGEAGLDPPRRQPRRLVIRHAQPSFRSMGAGMGTGPFSCLIALDAGTVPEELFGLKRREEQERRA